MSVIRPLLNIYLRQFEKRRLARSHDIAQARRAFARNARLFFHAPRGTRITTMTLPNDGSALRVTPRNLRSDLVVFYIHGGAFVFGSPETHAAMMGQLAARIGTTVVLPRYRLAPETPFPAAIDDIEHAYLALIASGVAASNIVIGGDSAGGTLVFNLLSQIIKRGWPKPRGVFVFSPFVDFAQEGTSYRVNKDRDAVLPSKRAGEMVQMYLGGHSADDPRISPLQADYAGAPPVWICVGDTEILHDDACRLQQRLKDQGVAVTFDEKHDLPHVWPLFHAYLPEARQTLDDLAGWITALHPSADEN